MVDFIEIKNFCSVKGKIKTLRKPQAGRKYLQKIYLIKLQRTLEAQQEENNQPLKKCTKDLNRYLTKEDTQIAKKI